MYYAECTTNDGCKLAFQTSIPLSGPGSSTQLSDTEDHAVPHLQKRLILLIHGFSGSSEYFRHNFSSLSKHAWVVALDLRGHGRSGRPRGGYHVARLAADVQNLIQHLQSLAGKGDPKKSQDLKIIPVGCSIGAAVLWTNVELFGTAPFSAVVAVDQSPLQDRNWLPPNEPWTADLAHRGCYNEATLRAAQQALVHTPAEARKGLVSDCLGYRVQPNPEHDDLSEARRNADEAFFTGISEQCDGVWLARLLEDHTRYDHREAIEEIDVPTLVLVGKRSGCFSLEGLSETVRRVEKGGKTGAQVRLEVFESGHWMFWEEPEKFNAVVSKFVEGC